MKRKTDYLLIILVTFLTNGYLNGQTATKQGTLSVRGNIQGIADRKVALFKRDEKNADIIIDSTTSSNDKFEFRREIKEPNLYTLFINGIGGGVKFIWDSNITIDGDSSAVWESTITGSALTDELKKFERENADPYRERIMAQQAPMRKARIDRDSITYNRLIAEQKVIIDTVNLKTDQYINSHPHSFISLLSLNSRKDRYGPERTKATLQRLDPILQKHSLAKAMLEEIAYVAHVGKGSSAPAFSAVDLTGTKVSMLDLKGKYVILDFWGTWCGPCLKLIPETKKAYDKYRTKNVEFISIAYDQEKDMEKLKHLVAKNQMNWYQVFQKYGDRSEGSIVNKYRVDAFPSIFLIDPSGTIVFRGIGEDGLREACVLLDKELSNGNK